MKRDVGIDVVKAVALLCVISVHCFSHIGYYQQPMCGKGMLFLTIVRNFFMICVPLFLMATGYLMNRKKFEKKYYKGIAKILYTYVIVSIICIIYKVVIEGYTTTWHMILSIFSFSAAGYSWYVEMYIGLFLIIPFLNLIYNNLKSQKQKRGLLFVMLFMTALPDAMNAYNFEQLSFWKHPAGVEINVIFPQYWTCVYPITYYFIGAYICEYKPKMNRNLNIVLIILSIFFIGLFCYWYSFESTFVWGGFQSYSSLFVVILSYLCFVFFMSIDYSKCGECFKKVLAVVSSSTLGAYLISEIFDMIIYSRLNESVAELKYKAVFGLIIVPVIFTLSVIISIMINKSYSLIKSIGDKKLLKEKNNIYE